MADDQQVQKDKAMCEVALQQELKRLATEAKEKGKTVEQLLEEGALDGREVTIGDATITFGRPRSL